MVLIPIQSAALISNADKCLVIKITIRAMVEPGTSTTVMLPNDPSDQCTVHSTDEKPDLGTFS